MSTERYGPVAVDVPPEGDAMARDPACFTAVPDDAPLTAMWQGVRYRFCRDECAERFRHDPEWYVESVLAVSSVERLCRRAHDRGEPIYAGHNPGTDEHDVVCHMTVPPDSLHRLEHEGSLYRFCAACCIERFRQWPERYLRASLKRKMHNHQPLTGDLP